MTIQTITSQQECITLLTVAGAIELLVPTPGKDACFGVFPVGEREYLVSCNDCGIYTVHFVADATQGEVMDFMRSLAGPGGITNARIEITGGSPELN